MRILYLVTKSEIGGHSTYLWALFKYAKLRGHEVFVMADKVGWLEDKTEELGFEFFVNKILKKVGNH